MEMKERCQNKQCITSCCIWCCVATDCAEPLTVAKSNYNRRRWSVFFFFFTSRGHLGACAWLAYGIDDTRINYGKKARGNVMLWETKSWHSCGCAPYHT